MSVERWATRVPGDPSTWVLDLKTMEYAAVCPVHEAPLSEGFCSACKEAPEMSVA